MAQEQQKSRLGALLAHVITWVEPFDDARFHWIFCFDGRPDLTGAFAVQVIHLSSGEPYSPFYVVEVPGDDKPHGWPLTRLDYTIRDRTVLVSDAVYAERLVDMWRHLALMALRALVSAPPQPD